MFTMKGSYPSEPRNTGKEIKKDTRTRRTADGRATSSCNIFFRTERHGRSAYNREIELLVSVEVYIFSYGIR